MPPDKIIACYIARHGATTLNQTNCFRGSADPPLAPEGIADAHKLAHYFSNIDLSAIFSSDRKRALQTADIISSERKLPVHKMQQLRALNVGNFSGQKRTPENEALLQQYIENPNVTIPGGESLNDFKARVRPVLMDAVDLFMDCGVPPLVVAHSSIVHEVGDMFYGNHKSILVQPGGAAAIYISNGKLGAEPIFKPVRVSAGDNAKNIS